jgi:hypothetical protein
VLARVRPEKDLLYGVVEPALALLKHSRTVKASESRS